jgi:hypothetical protein
MLLALRVMQSKVSHRKKQFFAFYCAGKIKYLLLDYEKVKFKAAEEYVNGRITRRQFHSFFRSGDFRTDYFTFSDPYAIRTLHYACFIIDKPEAVDRFILSLIYNIKTALKDNDDTWLEKLWTHLTKDDCDG